MSEQKGDLMTTAGNEGLNLAPRVAEGGERTTLDNVVKRLKGLSRAADRAATGKRKDFNEGFLMGQSDAFLSAADIVKAALMNSE